MSKMWGDVQISIAATPEDRAEAIDYIETFMRKTFGCEPPPTAGTLCIGRKDGHIVGSIVLQDAGGDGLFPLEQQYAFDETRSPFPFDRSLLVQGSRWTATEPNVSRALLHFSFGHALRCGKKYMLIEAKEYSAKHLVKLGMVCKELPGATLLPEKVHATVGDQGMKYYTEPPLPTLYVLDLEHCEFTL